MTATTPAFRPPANLRVAGQSGGTVSLAWDDSPDMPHASHHLVYVDGRLETIGYRAATIRHLAPGSHAIAVRAASYQRELTPPSAPATVFVDSRADRTPPSAPSGLRVTFDEVFCTFDAVWTASTDDVDPPQALVYDLLTRDWVTGKRYVMAYAVGGRPPVSSARTSSASGRPTGPATRRGFSSSSR